MTSDRVLNTGGAGFLGINLIRFLRQRGHAITSLDLAEFEYPDVRGQIRVVRGHGPAGTRRLGGYCGPTHARLRMPPRARACRPTERHPTQTSRLIILSST